MASAEIWWMLKTLVVVGVTISTIMEMEVEGTFRDTRDVWYGWRGARQTGGRGSSSSLNTILVQNGVHEKSRQKLLQGLSASKQQQLASDLTQLIRTLNEPTFKTLREQVKATVSKPMTAETALDVLSTLNGRFREFPWWNRINMLSIEKVW